MFVVDRNLNKYIYVFMSCFISYSLYDTLMVPWNVYMYVCVCVCLCLYSHIIIPSFAAWKFSRNEF